ncbi:hypothetical protein [Vibrio sp. 1978]|uniref:hypothetical protein n=1 Tax=Vibrio sp. 1978 TaxID=3074585 RepID=UPI00296719A9|nr:hypothetical protein [Vibrio sp. 1978]MDW3059223.1 hypothetical protein [Vibrio sp. 1978]
MAILANVQTKHGEDRELYVRINNVEASNHGVKSSVLFRGFLSQSAFNDGYHYLYEEVIELIVDPASPIWEQAYLAYKAKYPGCIDV